MKQNQSKSHSLRKHLLIVLISCLITVMVICTETFNIIYHQTIKDVDKHSVELSSETLDITSHGYYQMNLSAVQAINLCIGKNIGAEISDGQTRAQSDEELLSYVLERTKTYYNETNYIGSIIFVMSENGIQSLDTYSDTECNDITRELLALFDETVQADPEFYENQTSFYDYLYSKRETAGGNYLTSGKGQIIAWDNTINYCDYEACYGIIINEANSWLVEPIKQLTDEETAILNQKLGELFHKCISIMLALIAGVLLLFILISVMISKKLADPVVSEHDALIKINEMKTAFLSDVSHELKTPLAAMSGYAQNAELELTKGSDTAEIQEKLKRISSEANRMALMVTQILDATRIEEGRMTLELSGCDLDSLVRETAETYFAVLNKNNNRLSLRIPIELPPVNADSSRLQRVFVNLISNAMRHTHNGTILIQAEQDGDFVKVTVKDTGSGISAEDMPHIWERYYKGRQSETGTGLGLYICKFIIELHGGKIKAESEPGKGTAFIFTLPISR